MRTLLVWVQVKQFPIAVPFQEVIESLHEAPPDDLGAGQ